MRILSLPRWRWAVVAIATYATAEAYWSDGIFDLTPDLIPSQDKAGSEGLFPMTDCHGFALEEATIDEMQEAMGNGSLTSVQLLHCYMMRTFQTQQYIK